MKLLKYAKNLHQFKNDPIGFIVDTLVTVIVNLVIPIPLAGQVITQFRGPVLGCLGSIVVLGLFMIFVVGMVILSPSLLNAGLLQQALSSLTTNSVQGSDEGFIQSSIPSQNPLGGIGMSYTTITAGFMDPAYFIQFGKNHTGIDFVPNDTYFKNSKTYAETKKVIIYATHTGKANFFTDKNGGETVEVMNDEGTIKTIYIHFKNVYVDTGDTITAGKPLGEMGRTGFATGEHLHYEIQINESGKWSIVNPLTYIQ